MAERKKVKNARDKVVRVKGGFQARGLRFALVASQFNEYLMSELVSGTVDTLLRHGARPQDVQVVYVPGAFEIPLAVKKVLRKKWDAVIALGIVIRGETRHFDQIVNETARSLRDLCDKSEVPVILGVIPALSAAQAVERVGLKQMNKGREWALAAIETANLMKDRRLK